MIFLVINLPGPIMPIERGERFSDPLDDAFEKAGLKGWTVGGGTALSEVDDRKVITSCDIEFEVEDMDKALPLIRRVLIVAGAPPNTTIRRCDPEDVVYPLYEE
jgi:hypothetical protein